LTSKYIFKEEIRLSEKFISICNSKRKKQRPVLIEGHDIWENRITCLRVGNIVFVDESYIRFSKVKHKFWGDDSNDGLLAPLSEGQRLIIAHAGEENHLTMLCLSGHKHRLQETVIVRWIEIIMTNGREKN
jgi:hypothetical protein